MIWSNGKVEVTIGKRFLTVLTCCRRSLSRWSSQGISSVTRDQRVHDLFGLSCCEQCGSTYSIRRERPIDRKWPVCFNQKLSNANTSPTLSPWTTGEHLLTGLHPTEWTESGWERWHQRTVDIQQIDVSLELGSIPFFCTKQSYQWQPPSLDQSEY